MENTKRSSNTESSNALDELKKVIERRKERKSNPFQQTQPECPGQMVRTIYGVYGPIPMLRPTSRVIARERRRTKTKETQKKKQKVKREATSKPEMSIDAMGGSGPSLSGDSIHVPIPDFLMEAMCEQALSISGDVQEDHGFQSPELSPELKEMFRLFTNVDVD